MRQNKLKHQVRFFIFYDKRDATFYVDFRYLKINSGLSKRHSVREQIFPLSRWQYHPYHKMPTPATTLLQTCESPLRCIYFFRPCLSRFYIQVKNLKVDFLEKFWYGNYKCLSTSMTKFEMGHPLKIHDFLVSVIWKLIQFLVNLNNMLICVCL